jgi:FkbH-like protein
VLELAVRVSDESRSKTEQYRRRADAEALKAEFASQEDYLASLRLRVELSCDKIDSVARISELTAKSNQFNLTTRRYSESEIRALMASPDASVYSLVVGDKFGSAGLTGIAILRWQNGTAEIDSFLMSCRVIGRGVEFAIWSEILRDAAARGCTDIAADYLPTAKNAQVADFYDRLGLAPSDDSASARRYRAKLGDVMPPAAPWIEMVRCWTKTP